MKGDNFMEDIDIICVLNQLPDNKSREKSELQNEF